MATKAEREESRAALLSALFACRPDGNSTLVITELARLPSSSGVMHHLDVRVWAPDEEGRPTPTAWLTFHVARALGYRFARTRETIALGGYGYCRATQIASDLYRLAGHPLRVESLNTSVGPRGWVGK